MRTTFTFLFTCLILILNSQVYDDYIGAGHNEGVIVTSSHQVSSNESTLDGSGLDHNLIDVSRFLSHATLGANLDYISFVEEMGYEAWIEAQMETQRSSYLESTEQISDYIFQQWLDAGFDTSEYRITATQFRFAWSDIAINADDLLRQRIALALSEILVISTDSDLFEFGYGVASYYDLLSKHAFGNYKDLLMDIALHPCMGFYLSHLNNPRSDPDNNIHPDENFAREIMQLFTIGLYELNPDGSRKIGDDGLFIPTYDNDDIKELAKVFTGLGMGAWVRDDIVEQPRFGIPIYFMNTTVPMRMYNFWHEYGPKTIVGDFTIPAGQDGMTDIEMAVDHLFNHPNVGPFIGTRLIQRLVKSNPSPEYVERITNVFNNNGEGVRGDLGAVIKAILLDPEARNCEWIEDETNGRLKEPIQRYTQLLRALNAATDADYFWTQGFAFDYFTSQFPLHSPTVFNFFLPDYQPNSFLADEGLVAPEFQIFNSATSIGYINYMFYMTILDFLNELPNVLEELEIIDDYRAEFDASDLELLNTKPEAVLDYLDLVLAHGNLSDESKTSMMPSLEPLVDFPEFLIKLALYLTMISPDYAIMK